MASQSPFFSSPIPIINNKTHSFSPQPNNYHFFTFKNSKIQSSKTEPSLNSQEPDDRKLAFAKESLIEPIQGLKSNDQSSGDKEVPLALKLAMERAKEYKNNKGVVGSEAPNKKIEALKFDEVVENDEEEKDVPFAVLLALDKEKRDKNKSVLDTSETGIMGGNGRSLDEKNEALKFDEVAKNDEEEKDTPFAVLLAMEKEKRSKNKGVLDTSETAASSGIAFADLLALEKEKMSKNKGVLDTSQTAASSGIAFADLLALEKEKKYKNKGVLDTSLTAASSGVMGGNGRSPDEENPVKNAGKNEGLSISSILQDSSVKEVDGKNKALKSDEAVKDDVEKKEIPSALKLALEKAKEYKKNKGVPATSEASASGFTEGNGRSLEEKKPVRNAGKNEERSISSIDFVGLNFSDKKTGRGLPAGLQPISDPYWEGDFPEVEILVGDASKFGKAAASSPTAPVEDDTELYKPKVTTWGVFPRPSDISKAYGGGRTLRPGEALETAEERAAKQEKTKKMVAAYNYRTKVGLNIDPKLKAECEKALKDGDARMDVGQLKKAIPFYEKVMETLAFQSELHGLAALQWSICLDSLSRSKEARVMYEKLKSHPSPKVSKKARQFFFSFEAMEFMKVNTSSTRNPFTGYQKYFDAFVGDETNASLEDEADEDALSQILPFVFFLVSPILMVLLIAAFRSK